MPPHTPYIKRLLYSGVICKYRDIITALQACKKTRFVPKQGTDITVLPYFTIEIKGRVNQDTSSSIEDHPPRDQGCLLFFVATVDRSRPVIDVPI